MTQTEWDECADYDLMRAMVFAAAREANERKAAWGMAIDAALELEVWAPRGRNMKPLLCDFLRKRYPKEPE